MAIFDFDHRIVTGKTRILFDNYNVTSYKLHKSYKNPVYKPIINLLVDVAANSSAKSAFSEVISALEDITPRDMELLCHLHKKGTLDTFLALVRAGSTVL